MTNENLLFIWADKIALFAAAAFFTLFLLVVVLTFAAAGPAGAAHLIRSMGVPTLIYTPVIALSVDAFLRAIDFVCGGSTYRLFTAEHAPRAAQPDLGAFSPTA